MVTSCGFKSLSRHHGARPWYRITWTRGLGISAARRAMKSSGSKTTWLVPLQVGNWHRAGLFRMNSQPLLLPLKEFLELLRGQLDVAQKAATRSLPLTAGKEVTPRS